LALGGREWLPSVSVSFNHRETSLNFLWIGGWNEFHKIFGIPCSAKSLTVNAKLFLSMSGKHIQGVEVWLHSFIASVNITPRPLYHRQRTQGTIVGGWVGLTAGSEFWRRENICPLPGVDLRTNHSVA